jgi:hypothetical protein
MMEKRLLMGWRQARAKDAKYACSMTPDTLARTSILLPCLQLML